MSGRRFNTRGLRAQRGFGVFLFLVLIAGLGASAGLFTFYRTDEVQAQAERQTSNTLAAAKAALIGYAVGRGSPSGAADGPRPGELPCPDTNGDGLEDAPCNATTTLFGRLPWKTLGMPEPKDSGGESLWYALSGSFRAWNSFPAGTPSPQRRINSDTRGNLVVRAPDGTLITSAAAAVLLAPGTAVGSQNRGNTDQPCPGVSSQMCRSSYFEATVSVDAAGVVTGTFTMPARAGSSNDTVAYLDTAELIPAVEMRVGNELKGLLAQYRLQSLCQCYPWADTWPYSGGIADVGQNRGRFPTRPYPENWGDGTIPTLPAWVEANDWHNLFWYSIARQAADPARTCRTCTAAAGLSVGALKAAALFFTPGTSPDGASRLPPVMPGASLTSAQRSRADNASLYMQDAKNRNGAACDDVGEIGGPLSGWKWPVAGPNCDSYDPPSSKKHDRNRLHVLGATDAATCSANAKALASAAPCGTAWKVTNPTCQALMPTLDLCTCVAAVRTLAAPPCTNVIGPGACETARTQLLTCTLAP